MMRSKLDDYNILIKFKQTVACRPHVKTGTLKDTVQLNLVCGNLYRSQAFLSISLL